MAVLAKNIINGTPGDDILDGTPGVDFIYGGTGNDTLNGNDGNDVLYGGDGNDALYGGNGDDQLSGGVGADYMAGGAGNDTYFVDDKGDITIENAGEGTDTVYSYLLEYRLSANVENLIFALDGAQNGKGNDLDNKMRGNDFVNKMHGYGGNDTLFGYGGDDFLNPGTGHDVVDGGSGVDLVTYWANATHGVNVDLGASNFGGTPHVVYDYGDGTTDTLLVRNVENVEGTDFQDVLTGDAGNNKMSGRGGDDYIRGRAGNDDMNGGAGNDTFHFEAAGSANGVDIVHDFLTGDMLEFFQSDGYDPNAGFTYGKAAVGSGAQFVFNGSHELFYDSDGAGGAAMIKIASVLGDLLTPGAIKIIPDIVEA